MSTGGEAVVNAIDRTAYYNAVMPPGEDYAEGTQSGSPPAVSLDAPPTPASAAVPAPVLPANPEPPDLPR